MWCFLNLTCGCKRTGLLPLPLLPVVQCCKVKRDQGNKYKFRVPEDAVATEENKKENDDIQADKINKAFVTPDKIQDGHAEKIDKAQSSQNP
jgi:hypothetical protein